jgi:hypothetical protein
LADVTAVDQVADERPQLERDAAGVLDSEVADAPLGVQCVRVPQSVCGASVLALGAATAAASLLLRALILLGLIPSLLDHLGRFTARWRLLALLFNIASSCAAPCTAACTRWCLPLLLTILMFLLQLRRLLLQLK